VEIDMRIAVIASVILFCVTSALAQDKSQRPNADDLKKIQAALPEKAPATPKKPRKLLIFTKATGFVHSSIPVGAKTFELMGEKTGAYSTIVSDDAEAFAPERLKDVDAILMLSTTGELFVPKGAKAELLRDTSKPLTPELQRAKELRDLLIAFVKNGGGIMGVHAAADSSYQWKEYGEMMGGYFNGHPWGKITMRLDDPANPVNAAFGGKPFTIDDEIYTFRTPYSRERLHILTSIDLEASKIDAGFNRPEDHDYAVSWLNRYGQGRVFYCSLGHQEKTYWNPTVLKHYLAGLQYCMGDLEVDAEPSRPLSKERLEANVKVAARGWKDVSRGEKWYQDQKAVKEQTFGGVLEAVANAEGPSTLQRTRYYKLGDRMVFTGAKKSPALDALVGRRVEVRGKAVEMELEGQKLNELWAGQVRLSRE
jgi:type 1 glutamine amidotransferase